MSLKESKFLAILGEAKHFHTIEDSDENNGNGTDTFPRRNFSLGLSLFLGSWWYVAILTWFKFRLKLILLHGYDYTCIEWFNNNDIVLPFTSKFGLLSKNQEFKSNKLMMWLENMATMSECMHLVHGFLSLEKKILSPCKIEKDADDRLGKVILR